MTEGQVRAGLPRVTLALPGEAGPLSREFILDTGFEGELAMPASDASQLVRSPAFAQRVRLADGSERERSVYLVTVDWNDEPRLTEVLVLEGSPLLGSGLLAEQFVQREMTDNGAVSIEPL